MPLQDKLRLLQDDGFRLILTLSFLWILAKLLYAFALSPLRSIPGPKVARITALRAIRKRLPKNVIRYALHDFHTYGDIYISKPDTITLSNPVHARTVLGALDSRKMDIYKSLSDPVMKNLVTFSEPCLASQRRRQIGPYLNSPSYLARMEQVVLQYGAVSMMQKWNEQLNSAASGDNDEDRDTRTIELNYRNDTQLATFNIMSVLAFGRVDKATSDSSTVVDWIAATAVYIGISINFRILLRFPLSLLVRPWLRKYDDFVGYARESVRQRKELLDENPDDKTPADMLQAFIDAEDPDSRIKMSPLEVQAESVGMQLAGSETTSASLTWAFHLLTLYPDVLDRAVGQVRSRFGADHLISYTDCKQHLPYLEALVYETFRFAPITSGFMPRVCSKDMSFQGYRVPAGTHIAFNLMAMNNHPDVWDQPDRFLPERFLGNEDAKRNIFAFSYGPRSCIGKNLAWMEIMTILANVLNTFDIRLPEDAVYGPHHVDGNGTPVMMPSHCHIVFAPQRPDRDCKLLVSRRPPPREAGIKT